MFFLGGPLHGDGVMLDCQLLTPTKLFRTKDVDCEYRLVRITEGDKVDHYVYVALGISSEAARWLLFAELERHGTDRRRAPRGCG